MLWGLGFRLFHVHTVASHIFELRAKIRTDAKQISVLIDKFSDNAFKNRTNKLSIKTHVKLFATVRPSIINCFALLFINLYFKWIFKLKFAETIVHKVCKYFLDNNCSDFNEL